MLMVQQIDIVIIIIAPANNHATIVWMIRQEGRVLGDRHGADGGSLFILLEYFFFGCFFVNQRARKMAGRGWICFIVTFESLEEWWSPNQNGTYDVYFTFKKTVY
jgi:hypothetical protein